MSIFDNFNKDVAIKQVEKAKEEEKKEAEKEQIVKELIEENNEQEYKKNGKNVFIPSYDLFKEYFMDMNKNVTEEDYEFIFKKKKGIYYINFDKAANYNIPHGKCIGMTLLERRKFTKKDITCYVRGNRTHKVYNDLPTTPIGAIPVSNNEYIVVTRRRVGIFNILWPLIFIRMAARQFLGV